MMNKLRRACAVAIVTAVLAVSALGGQLDSPGVVAPPPPSQTSPSITGIIDSPGAVSTPPSQTTSTSTSITTVILTILTLIR